MFDLLKEWLWNPGTLGVALIILFVSQAWARYRRRSSTIRWRVLHQPLAITARDQHHGTIEVRHNGQLANSVFFSSMELQNDSSIDYENVRFTFTTPDGVRFLSGVGTIEGCSDRLLPDGQLAIPAPPIPGQVLSAGGGVQTIAVAAPAANIAMPAPAQNQLDFVVPTLNRYTKLTFNFLLDAAPARQAKIQLSCLHKGIRTKEKNYPQFIPAVLAGESALKASIVGINISIVFVIWLCFSHPVYWGYYILVLSIGVLNNFVGLIAIKIFKMLNRFFG